MSLCANLDASETIACKQRHVFLINIVLVVIDDGGVYGTLEFNNEYREYLGE